MDVPTLWATLSDFGMRRQHFSMDAGHIWETLVNLGLFPMTCQVRYCGCSLTKVYDVTLPTLVQFPDDVLRAVKVEEGIAVEEEVILEQEKPPQERKTYVGISVGPSQLEPGLKRDYSEFVMKIVLVDTSFVQEVTVLEEIGPPYYLCSISFCKIPQDLALKVKTRFDHFRQWMNNQIDQRLGIRLEDENIFLESW